jgi:hypothetical protein
MITNDIDALIGQNQPPCVSILIPGNKSDIRKTYDTCKKEIKRAEAMIRSYAIPDAVKKDLLFKLEDSFTKIPAGPFVGWGAFISPGQYQTFTFPFEVIGKVVAGKTFASRDLLYLRQYAIPYYVLHLTKQGVHLFVGHLNILQEIMDDHFPMPYSDCFEYQSVSPDLRARTRNKANADKGGTPKSRLQAIFRDASGQLAARTGLDDKVFLAGTQDMIQTFQEMGEHIPIAGKITGTFHDTNVGSLCDRAWLAFDRTRKKDIEAEIANLELKKGNFLATGITEAWSAVNKGKGSALLVEKDVHHRGYQIPGKNTLYLQPPKKPYFTIDDVENELIASIRVKNGEVILTENGLLELFNHIVLVDDGGIT